MSDQKRFLGPFMFRSRRIKNKINNIQFPLAISHSLSYIRKLVYLL